MDVKSINSDFEWLMKRKFIINVLKTIVSPFGVFMIYFIYYYVFVVRLVYKTTSHLDPITFILRLGPIFYLLVALPLAVIPPILLSMTWKKILQVVKLTRMSDSIKEKSDIIEQNVPYLRRLGFLAAIFTIGWWIWSDVIFRFFMEQAYGKSAFPTVAVDNILISLGIGHAIIVYILWENYMINSVLSDARSFALTRRVNIPYWLKTGLLSYMIPLILSITIFGTFSSGLAAIRKSVGDANWTTKDIISQIRTLHIQAAIFFVITFIFYFVILLMIIPPLYASLKQLMNQFETLVIESPEQSTKTSKNLNGSLESSTTEEHALQVLPLNSADEYGLVFTYFNSFIMRLHENVTAILSQQEELDEFFESLVTSFKEFTSTYHEVSQSTNDVAATSQTQAQKIDSLIQQLNVMKDEFSNLASELKSFSSEFTEITQQIRIVSLNASIEAARMHGEESAGFNVIAETIRSLNEESSRLHASLVKAVTEKLARVDQIVQQIFVMSNDLSTISEMHAAASEEINAAMEEQVATIQQLYQQTLEAQRNITEITQRLQRYKKLKL